MNLSPLMGLLDRQAIIKLHHDLMWGQNSIRLSQVIPTINHYLDCQE